MAFETLNVDLGSSRIITALQPVMNAEDWFLELRLFENDAAYDLDGSTATMSIRDGWGSEVLSATGALSDNEDSVTSIVTFTFRGSSMGLLAAGSYHVGVILTESPATRQVLSAKLPVRDGGFG